MRSLVPVFAAAMVPFAVIALIVVGSGVGLVQWHPPQIWSADFGTSNSGNGIMAISADATGVYATGFVGYSNLNVTPSLLFVNRYDLNGHELWTQTFGNPNSLFLSRTYAVGLASQAVYVAGALNGTSFVKQYDLNGNQVWVNVIGLGAAVATSATTLGVYVGYYQGSNSFLRLYDSSGNILWTDLLGNHTGSLSVLASSTGAYVFDGENSNTLVRKYDTNGLLVWSRVCPCNALGVNGISGDSTGIYVLGVALGSVGDALIVRYDVNGNKIWTTQFRAPDNFVVVNRQISADPSGAYLTITTGGGRSFLMKYDTNGNRNWSFQIQPIESLLIPGIPVSVGGNSLFVGGSFEKSSGTLDAYLAQFGQSSSLIFFGINPPWSFMIVAAFVAVASISIWFFRKRYLRRLASRPKSTSADLRFPRD